MSQLPDRLRDLADAVTACEWDLPITAHEDCLRAAEEIERLRGLLRELRDCVVDWEMSPAHVDCGCATCGEIKALAAKAGGR